MKASPEEIEREVETIRNDLDPVLSELDHRRHEMLDWKRQLQRRGPALLKAAVMVAGAWAAFQGARRLRRRSKSRRSGRGAMARGFQ